MKRLQEAAKQKAQEAETAYFDALEKVGMPKDQVSEYEVKQRSDKSLTFTRKAK